MTVTANNWLINFHRAHSSLREKRLVIHACSIRRRRLYLSILWEAFARVFVELRRLCLRNLERMSFLAGRLAATEGAFFNQHSKQAAIALKQKLNPNSTPSSTSNPNLAPGGSSSQADVLPEVLRHSLPITPHSAAELVQQVESAPAATSIAATINLTLNPRRAVGVKHDGGLRGAVAVEHLASVPQTTFGRKKWAFQSFRHGISSQLMPCHVVSCLRVSFNVKCK